MPLAALYVYTLGESILCANIVYCDRGAMMPAPASASRTAIPSAPSCRVHRPTGLMRKFLP